MSDEKRINPENPQPKIVLLDDCTPELKLAQFLTDLATDRDNILERFKNNPEEVMTESELSEAAKEAIRESRQNDVLRLICMSQQNS